MFLDDLAEQYPRIAKEIEGAVVVRLPFQLFRDISLANEEEEDLRADVTRILDVNGMDSPIESVFPKDFTFCRAPFNDMVFIGHSSDESGFLRARWTEVNDRLTYLHVTSVFWSRLVGLSMLRTAFEVTPDGPKPPSDPHDVVLKRLGYESWKNHADGGDDQDDDQTDLTPEQIEEEARARWCIRHRWAPAESDDECRETFEIPGADEEQIAQLLRSRALPCLAGYALMNCRNIQTLEVIPSQSLQKKRVRNGKLPLYRYHVLRLKPRSKRGRSVGESGLDMAIHWVRGHFKEYGKSGLFGKHRGLYWWTPHLAGSSARVVDKSYRIAAPNR